jgi:3-oxoacyl-[acyl-carrier-protein] synthase II
MRAVVITGMGAVSALGFGVRSLARVLEEPVSGIARVTHFDTTGFTTTLGAVVPGRGDGEPAIAFARAAASEALAQAKLDPARIALVLGSSLGTAHERLYELTDLVADAIGVCGPRITVSTACSSSSNAIGLARDLVVSGVVDAAIAGGTDVLSPELFAGFHALGVLSKEPCAPFSFPEGTTLGEGAGFVVIERASNAERRGVTPLAWLLGYGLSCDAHHPTTPDPSGMGVARAIRAALSDAAIDPAAIGYVNAHATGTSANDPAEMLGIAAGVGHDVPVSGSKSFLGHAQGAAGVLEIIVTILGLGAQRLPPTLHVKELRRSAPKDVVPIPRAHAFDVALSLNSAFAGANTAVVLSRKPHPAPARKSVVLHVLGGARLEGSQESLRRDLPMADPRGMDPSTRWLASACARALADAGIKASGELRDRAGLIAAVSGYSAESAAEFRRSIEERGLPKVNATAFAKMVLNAPAGVAATLLSLRGATSTLTTGRGGGALAIAYAAELLTHGANDLLVAASVDERTEADGAAAIVLGMEARGPVLAAWILGPPGADLLPAALDRAGLSGTDVKLDDDSFPRFLSAGSTMACVRALELLRDGARSVSVVTRGGGASAALVFRSEAA